MLWNVTRPDPLEFEPWPAGFGLRTLPAGAVSSLGSPALIGVEKTGPDPDPRGIDICGGLFDGAAATAVPVAFFTDHYCPNCRAMAAQLDERSDLEVTLHELPLLGEDSVVAARAALAADLQGGRGPFHQRLRRAVFAPTEAYVRDVATGLGLDAERLIDDMDGPAVTAALDRDLRLARELGLGAVPATVVGSTVLVGNVAEQMLDRVVELEREAPQPCMRR